MANFPRFDAQRGRVTIWCRQYGDTGERSTPALIETLGTYGYSGFAPKVADGLNWQARNDPTGATPFDSLAAVAEVRDDFAAAGIAFLPVVVPRHWPGDDTPDPGAQGEFHGQIARLCGCLVTDCEPYAGFWLGNPDGLIEYAKALRAAAGDAYLINQPDPRPFGMADARVAETAGQYDAIMAQHYVGWASAGWTDVAGEVNRVRGIRLMGRETYVTAYGVERTDLAIEFCRRAVADGVAGINVFCLGPMTIANLQTFGGFIRGIKPNPIPGTEPIPDPGPLPPGPVVPVIGIPAAEVRALITEVRQWGIDDVGHLAEAARIRGGRLDDLLAQWGIEG